MFVLNLKELLDHIWEQSSSSESKEAVSSEPYKMEVLMDQVADYIREHYQDPLLSVGMIADEDLQTDRTYDTK